MNRPVSCSVSHPCAGDPAPQAANMQCNSERLLLSSPICSLCPVRANLKSYKCKSDICSAHLPPPIDHMCCSCVTSLPTWQHGKCASSHSWREMSWSRSLNETGIDACGHQLWRNFFFCRNLDLPFKKIKMAQHPMLDAASFPIACTVSHLKYEIICVYRTTLEKWHDSNIELGLWLADDATERSI